MKYIETENIIRIPIDVSLSTKTWKMTIKNEFNGKILKDVIKLTKEGEIKSCKLDNIFSATEYIALTDLKDVPITDEQIETGILNGLKSIIQRVLATVEHIEEDMGTLPPKWSTLAYVVLAESFTTIGLEVSLQDFLSLNPEGKENLPESVFNDIGSIIISEDRMLVMLIGKDGEILSASIDDEEE